MIDRSLKRLSKKSRRGFRGYPVATIAAYGPDDRRASKLVATIVRWDGDDAGELREEHSAQSVAMPDRIIGFPHEEGVDYEGEFCPACFFWMGRDRWTGQLASPASRRLH